MANNTEQEREEIAPPVKITYTKAEDGGKFYTDEQIKALIETEATRREQQTAKAYGGCTMCYGKGYASYKAEYRARGMRWDDPENMKFCSCDRGKQLELLVAELKRQAKGEK